MTFKFDSAKHIDYIHSCYVLSDMRNKISSLSRAKCHVEIVVSKLLTIRHSQNLGMLLTPKLQFSLFY